VSATGGAGGGTAGDGIGCGGGSGPVLLHAAKRRTTSKARDFMPGTSPIPAVAGIDRRN